MRTGRVEWRGAEANIRDAVRKIEAAGGPKGKSWQSALAAARMPLYDVHWRTAVILLVHAFPSRTDTIGSSYRVVVVLAGARRAPITGLIV